MKKLNFKHFECLAAVHKYGSTKEASKALGISHSGILHQIRRIEQFLGFQMIIPQRKDATFVVNPEHLSFFINLTQLYEDLCILTNPLDPSNQRKSSASLVLNTLLFKCFIAPFYKEFTDTRKDFILNVKDTSAPPFSKKDQAFNEIVFTSHIDKTDKEAVYIPFHSFTLRLLTTEKNLLEKGRVSSLFGLKTHTLVFDTTYAPYLQAHSKEAFNLLNWDVWEEIIHVEGLSLNNELFQIKPSMTILPEEILKLQKIEALKVLPELSLGKLPIYLKMNKYFSRSTVATEVIQWLLKCRDRALKEIGQEAEVGF